MPLDDAPPAVPCPEMLTFEKGPPVHVRPQISPLHQALYLPKSLNQAFRVATKGLVEKNTAGRRKASFFDHPFHAGGLRNAGAQDLAFPIFQEGPVYFLIPKLGTIETTEDVRSQLPSLLSKGSGPPAEI